jgi:8-oxo-(d)GTP phosphatase
MESYILPLEIRLNNMRPEHEGLPVRPVTAAGGYVIRRSDAGIELLMIFRRGVWDLPKGKLDPGERIEEAALREVREEVGISQLELVRPLGTTEHGYHEKGFYMVKTTHWFEMCTSETDFTPDTGEDIERVAWVPWAEARQCIGFETLRRHMDDVETLLTDKNDRLYFRPSGRKEAN